MMSPILSGLVGWMGNVDEWGLTSSIHPNGDAGCPQSAFSQELLSTVSWKSRIFNCRHAIPTVSTENNILKRGYLHFKVLGSWGLLDHDCHNRKGPTVDSDQKVATTALLFTDIVIKELVIYQALEWSVYRLNCRWPCHCSPHTI